MTKQLCPTDVNWFYYHAINRESSLMKELETMEASAAAATRFCVVLCCSVVIQYLANEAECRDNYGKPNVYNCPQGCRCDEHSKTVNCSDAGFEDVPRGIDSNTLGLILDHTPIHKLTNRSFGNLHNLQNLSLRSCSIEWVDKNAFSSFRESLRVRPFVLYVIMYIGDDERRRLLPP